MTKKAINIVWFKRDLRFSDHEPLFLAQKEEIPVLLIYFFEPSVMNYDDSDVRHFWHVQATAGSQHGVCAGAVWRSHRHRRLAR